MKKSHYEIEQDRFYIKRILKFFEQDFYPPQEEIKTDVEFLEQYKVKDLFLKIINRFNPELHLPHSKKLLLESIEKWNENKPEENLDLKVLNEKFYLIQSEMFAIINPYLLRKTEDPPTSIMYKFYESLDKKGVIYYPFFYGNHIEESIKEMDYGVNFNIKELIDDEEDLFDAIFHNYKGMRRLFKVAVTEYLIGISYSEWEKEINKYFYLLVALNSMEFNISYIINSLGTFKEEKIKGYALHILNNKTEILNFEKDNFLQRLLYAPYEINGINIYNPPEGSSLVPYSDKTEEEKNLFKRIASIDRWINNNYEIGNLFHYLFGDIEFIIWNLGNEFSLAEWEKIYESCDSDFYKLEFLNSLSLKKDKWTELNNLNFFPFVIHQLFNSSTNIYLLKESELNLSEIKFNVAKYFIDSIAKGKEDDLIVLLNLFLSLPVSPNKFEYDYQYEAKKKIRDYIIEIFSEIKSKIIFDLALDRIRDQLGNRKDFSAFDIFEDYWEYSDELREIIITHYYNILDEKVLIEHYYDIDGKENLYKAISTFNEKELKDFLGKYDFISFYEKEAEKSENVYNEGVKLRFHLGILIEYALNYEKHRIEIAEYIFNTYKRIIKIESEIFEPLSWDAIVSDTFSFNRNFNKGQLLSIILIDLLLIKNEKFVSDFFNEIKENLSFTELSFYQKKFPDNEVIKNIDLLTSFPQDLKGTGLGRAQREVQLLLENNYPDKVIKYVDYIESLGKKYLSNDIKEIKFRAYLILNDFDNAKKTLKAIEGNSDNLYGLLLYFKEDFPNAVGAFQRYHNRIKALWKGDIINYSAALIRNNQPQEAITLLEENIGKYPNEFLIYKNLGAAYSKINKGKALYYLLLAKDLTPNLTDTSFAVYESIIEIIPELEKILNDFPKDPSAANELLSKFHSTVIPIIQKTFNQNPTDIEKLIVKEIYYAIEQLRKLNYGLEKFSENEISDQLKIIIQASLKDKGIIIEREAPVGYALVKSGELDFFIYSNDTKEIYSVGENKEWSINNFENQLKQLFGNSKANRGFCFTIIFNKTEDLQIIKNEREKILSTFFIEDNGIKYFEMTEIIPDASVLIDGIKDVVLTLHKNPEDDSIVRVYHFIIDGSERVRKASAKQARTKGKRKS